MDTPRRTPLAVALAQPLLRPHDLAANAAAHAEAIRTAGARLAVFPELSLTSYALKEIRPIALDDPALAVITEACADTGAVALAGAPIADPDGREYIAMLRFDGDGPSVAYRKMHPHGSESRFAAGTDPAVLELDGWRLGLAICRDSSVDAHLEATAALDIDAYVGGNLHDPDRARRSDERMPKAAARYGIWVAMSCFAGPGSDFPVATGGSAVWAPDGSLVAQADDRSGRIVTAVLR